MRVSAGIRPACPVHEWVRAPSHAVGASVKAIRLRRVNGMSWSWRLENVSGDLVEVADTEAARFPSRADAESWLGETWRELLDAGVDQVRLLEEDRGVYGPMSLHPA